MKPLKYAFRKELDIGAGTICVILLCLIVILCTGCASVRPDNVQVGVEHLSSISQHFGADKTNIGLEMATVTAHWQPTKHTYLDVQDAYIFGSGTFAGKDREVFEAKAGFIIPTK